MKTIYKIMIHFISIYILYASELSANTCLNCHETQKSGLSDAHKNITCISCHLGDDNHPEKNLSHRNLIAIPGNLDKIEASCGRAECHQSISIRVKNSLMNHTPGIIDSVYQLFNQKPKPENFLRKNLHESFPGQYLQEKCVGCHLGNPKISMGIPAELDTGGGCLACHLSLDKNEKNHRNITLQVTDQHCFSCHSRSSRISLSYQGWHEVGFDGDSRQKKHQYKTLSDGRLLIKKSEDIHHQKGLECIDCHLASEIMGDGQKYEKKEKALEISCSDCHFQKFTGVAFSELPPDIKNLIRLRNIPNPQNKKFGKTKKNSKIIYNLYEEKKKVFLWGKNARKKFELKPLNKNHIDRNHLRLDCKSCHTAWAPQCIGCHIQRDEKEQWHEFSSDFFSDSPTLGMKRTGYQSYIVPFVPGMILTKSENPISLQEKNINNEIQKSLLTRKFSPMSAHTIQTKTPSCEGCHINPNVYGFGRGQLTLAQKWVFQPTFERLSDGLPADSWVSFDSQEVYTGEYTPLDYETRQRMLKVGECLYCHKSKVP